MSSLLKKYFTILLILSSCGGLEESEKEKIRKGNIVVERIYRHDGETPYQIEPDKHRVREPYSWEEKR